MKPAIIIMAYGIGSRYGGLKQIASVDDNNISLLTILFTEPTALDLEK